MEPADWHVSMKREAQPTNDAETGEVRIPVDLFAVDELVATVPLVLSRAEAHRLHAELGGLLAVGSGEAA